MLSEKKREVCNTPLATREKMEDGAEDILTIIVIKAAEDGT
jgi:hypothetical protein